VLATDAELVRLVVQDGAAPEDTDGKVKVFVGRMRVVAVPDEEARRMTSSVDVIESIHGLKTRVDTRLTDHRHAHHHIRTEIGFRGIIRP
jgi:hypothetical protein